MAAASKADDVPPAAAAAPAPARKGGGIGVLAVAILISVAASGGLAWFISQQALAEMRTLARATDGEAGDGAPAEPEKPKGPPVYVPLDPAFVVNLTDPSGLRFLQLQIEVMSRDPKVPDQIKQHMPRIRNALLLLLGQQKIAELSERSGKENLQAAVLVEIQKILKEEAGAPGVEAVYFTSFVMQ